MCLCLEYKRTKHVDISKMFYSVPFSALNNLLTIAFSSSLPSVSFCNVLTTPLESNRGTLHTVYWNLVTLLQILMLPTVYWTLGPVPSRNINVTYGILNPWPDPRNKELCYDISEIPIVFYRLFEKTIVFSKRRSSYRLLKRRSSFEKTIVF